MSVLVVGDVIEDILVSPSGAIRPDTDTNASIQVSNGGSAANFACWLASEGVEVNFVGRVAASDLESHSKDLKSHGVTPHLQADQDLATGRIVVLVEGEQRSFLTDRGANQNLDLDAIPDELFDKALYISGYSLLSADSGSIRRLITKARNLGCLVVCDPGSAGFIEDFGANRFLEALVGVDVFLPSLSEGRILTGEARPEVISAMLRERFPLVALTLGAEGVQICQSEENFHVPAPLADLIDATGAGDAFAASFLKSLLHGETSQVAAAKAVRAGAIAVTRHGGRPERH